MMWQNAAAALALGLLAAAALAMFIWFGPTRVSLRGFVNFEEAALRNLARVGRRRARPAKRMRFPARHPLPERILRRFYLARADLEVRFLFGPPVYRRGVRYPRRPASLAMRARPPRRDPPASIRGAASSMVNALDSARHALRSAGVERFRLNVKVGLGDCAATAIAVGSLWAAIYAVCPRCGPGRAKEVSLRVEPDFFEEKISASFDIAARSSLHALSSARRRFLNTQGRSARR